MNVAGERVIALLVVGLLAGGGAGFAVGKVTSDDSRDTRTDSEATEQLVNLLDDSDSRIESLEETNDQLMKRINRSRRSERKLKREVKRLATQLEELRSQSTAAASDRVLCDPGGCENPSYSPNPAYGTYCEPGATFAHEGQCSYGD